MSGTPRDPLRVGVVGVGVMGADHVERLARRISRARLVAVSDPDLARAEAVAATSGVGAGGPGGVRVYADPRALVAAPEVDAVLLASPGAVHEEQVLACLEVGKPVLCEKPLTMDTASALRVVEAERASGCGLVQVGFMRRFDPELASLKGALDTGELGRLLLVHNVHRNRAAQSPTFRSEMAVRDSLVHEIDVARFLFGEEVASVHVLSPAPTSLAPEGVVDPQVAIFTMAGGGVVTNEVFINAQTGYEVRCEVVCERGSLIAGRPWGGLYRTSDTGWGGAIPADYRPRFAAAYDLEVQAWVDACLVGARVGPTAWDGLAATAVAEAGIRSLESGQPVAVVLPGGDAR